MSHHADQKWLLFKNFLHNELGISKEDIQEWVKEAIHEEVEKVVKQRMSENDKFDLDDVIRKVILDNVMDSGGWGKPAQFKAVIKDKVVDLLVKNLQIDVGMK